MGGPAEQYVDGQRCVAVHFGIFERLKQRGREPLIGMAGHAHFKRDTIGGLKPDATDIARQAVGIGHDLLERTVAIAIHDPLATHTSKPMALQEHDQFAALLAFMPNVAAFFRQFFRDARDLGQPFGLLAQNAAQIIAEMFVHAFGKRFADAGNRPARQILFDGSSILRWRDPQDLGLQAAAPSRVIMPKPLSIDLLAHLSAGRVTQHHHGFFLICGINFQNCKAIVAATE